MRCSFTCYFYAFKLQCATIPIRTQSLSSCLFLSSCVLDFVRHGSHTTHSSLCLPITAVLSLACFHPTRMRFQMHFISIAQLGSDIYVYTPPNQAQGHCLRPSFHYAMAAESVQTCKSHLQMCECHCTRKLH